MKSSISAFYKNNVLFLVLGIFIIDLLFLSLFILVYYKKQSSIFLPALLIIIFISFWLVKAFANTWNYKNLYVQINNNRVFINDILGTYSFKLDEINSVSLMDNSLYISVKNTKYQIKLSKISNSQSITDIKRILKV